jgi:NTE family protein
MVSRAPDATQHVWRHLAGRLMQLLHDWLPDVQEPVLREVADRLERVALPGGQTLLRQGEPGDALYLVVSGRLRAYVRDGEGTERAVRDMGRGQLIGEMSLITGEPRSATVVAVRHSVLARLDPAGFEGLQTSSPALSRAITRQIIERLRSDRRSAPGDRPATIALVPITAGIDAAGFAHALAERLAEHGSTVTLGALTAGLDPDANSPQRMGARLDDAEAEHDFVLLAADTAPTPWTEACVRHADEILLLADAKAPVALHPTEQALLQGRPGRAEAAEILVLLHPADAVAPVGTARWLARRPLAEVVHVRAGQDRDMARLARLQARRAVGLVLAGGGARGFAHLGVARALAAAGIEVDVFGGTSMGAAMAAVLATDRPLDEVIDEVRSGFSRNPTGDFALTPVLSLIKGERMRTVTGHAFVRLAGPDAGLEDLWKPCFCVVTNYSQAREEVWRTGSVERAIVASTAIPGALPPLVEGGDLFVDGAIFNNFPVDVMRRTRGVGVVLGVDLVTPRNRPLALDRLPSNLQLFLDWLRPRRMRRYRLPSLVAILMKVNVMYSMSRQAEAHATVDLIFKPPTLRVGMLQWRKFDTVVAEGLSHAREVLARADLSAVLERGAPPPPQ